jgi:hypothetical protein
MKRFKVEVVLRKTDMRIVKADSIESARALAKDIYERAGYSISFIGAEELDKEEKIVTKNMNEVDYREPDIKFTAKEIGNMFQTPSDSYGQQLSLDL